jgi:hypothetical protein
VDWPFGSRGYRQVQGALGFPPYRKEARKKNVSILTETAGNLRGRRRWSRLPIALRQVDPRQVARRMSWWSSPSPPRYSRSIFKTIFAGETLVHDADRVWNGHKK